jgi:hypothetical protein
MINAAASLLHAGVGGRSNSPWPNDSLLAPGSHCKHARHPRSDWNRHRLQLRDRQPLGRSLDGFRQVALVLLVWGHFTMGLHFWWRLFGWYRRAFPAILVAFVLILTVALLGFAEVGMTMTARARSDPQWMQATKARVFLRIRIGPSGEQR